MDKMRIMQSVNFTIALIIFMLFQLEALNEITAIVSFTLCGIVTGLFLIVDNIYKEV